MSKEEESWLQVHEVETVSPGLTQFVVRCYHWHTVPMTISVRVVFPVVHLVRHGNDYYVRVETLVPEVPQHAMCSSSPTRYQASLPSKQHQASLPIKQPRVWPAKSIIRIGIAPENVFIVPADSVLRELPTCPEDEINKLKQEVTELRSALAAAVAAATPTQEPEKRRPERTPDLRPADSVHDGGCFVWSSMTDEERQKMVEKTKEELRRLADQPAEAGELQQLLDATSDLVHEVVQNARRRVSRPVEAISPKVGGRGRMKPGPRKSRKKKVEE